MAIAKSYVKQVISLFYFILEENKVVLIERLNNTLRQRISRLVRKTRSFSKKLENHIGAIWYFIHHYNASLA